MATVSLKQIRAFVAVADARSFAEAAARLHLSQPALSLAIKSLEESMGGQLLARTTRSFALTPEGEEFLPIARRLLRDWDSALDDLTQRFALQTGRITLAAMPSFAANLLPRGLALFKQQHPNIRLVLHDVIAEEVVRLVRLGQAELGISFDPGQQDDLHFIPLFDDHFVAALPPDHPLAGQTSVSVAELAAGDMITLQAPSQLRQLIADLMAARQLPFAPAMEAHQLITIGRMVASGLGVSLVPALSQPQMQEVGACCRPLQGGSLSRKVGLLSRSRYPLSAAAQALHKVLQTAFAV